MPLTYAIGDIHGRADLLEAMLEKIRDDASRAGVGPHRLITLGDYVSRGPAAKRVLELVDKGLDGIESIRLKGNHEAMLTSYLTGKDDHWALAGLRNGCPEDILTEAGETIFYPAQVVSKGSVARVKEYLGPTLLRLLRSLRTHYFDRRMNILFVHAGIRPGVPLEDQTEEDMLQIRSEFHDFAGELPFTVVHGHTIIGKAPTVRGDRVNLDTGAYRNGVLSAAVFDDRSPNAVRFIQVNGQCGSSAFLFRNHVLCA